MKKQSILPLILSAIFVIAAAEPVMAYTLLSPRRRWATTPISVRVYSVGNSTITDGDGGVTAVVGAIRAWGIISSGTTGSAAVRGSAPATIMLNSNGGGLCTGNCLAATLTGYYTTQTGDDRIYDADIYTNTAIAFYSSREAGCSSEYDIDGVMTHEAGHVIGLGHSSVAGATMYPSVSACNTSPRSLAADDIAAR
ncbi:MAG TPA: matrixin family metalloprotease, partial [Thermoanaerobaculia bacterium]|nr:matrixin family metalloprotease [Thermoanaerobaculia bacterium]